MIFETERLELVPLDAHLLDLWVNDMPAFEKKLNCTYKGEPLEGFYRKIVSGQIEKAKNDPDNYIYHGFWLMIRKSDRVAVGSADFKDVPNEKGEVEIGYGQGEEFEHQGYMTETVKKMIEWAKQQDDIKFVLAETNTDNFKSQNVLKRCGFVLESEGKTFWWRLTL